MDALSVGMTYSDEDAVKKVVAEYNREQFTYFTVTTNNKKSLILKCKHGRKRNYDGIGKRPNQTYNFIGCSASVNFYKSQKNGSLKITQSCLDHNHDCWQRVHDLNNEFDKSDEEFVLTLNSATARPSQIKRVLKEQRGKNFSTKKIRNLIQKLAPTDEEDNIPVNTYTS